MIPSAEFAVVPGCYKGSSALPEGVQSRALLASVSCLDKCTTNAKEVHTKSSTYGAKFEVMCKRFQQDVTIHGIAEPCAGRINQAVPTVKSLKEHEKQGLGTRLESGSGNYYTAHELHSWSRHSVC
jgi:hypothetical protein